MVSSRCCRVVMSLSGRRNQRRNNLLPIGDLVLLAIPVDMRYCIVYEVNSSIHIPNKERPSLVPPLPIL